MYKIGKLVRKRIKHRSEGKIEKSQDTRGKDFYRSQTNKKEIKDLTPVRGQDGKISDTQGKDFWSPTRFRRVGDQ
jgi:hypothetical protein